MQCAEAETLGYAGLVEGTRVCERPRADADANVVYLNALHDSLPACDRARGATTLDALEHAAECHVYCAQRTCHAAEHWMQEHAAELGAKCDRVTYLRNGALAMDARDLADGARCHADVLAHNAKGDAPCLTCEDKGVTPMRVTVDGVDVPARYTSADADAPPEWFARRAIYGTLPPQFTCDPRYRRARDADAPAPYDGAGAATLAFAAPADVPPDALLGVWAAEASDEVREAHVAYGDFENASIVRCAAGTCEMRLDLPGAYTAEGKNYDPHLHFAVWRGDRWADVRTVAFTPAALAAAA